MLITSVPNCTIVLYDNFAQMMRNFAIFVIVLFNSYTSYATDELQQCDGDHGLDGQDANLQNLRNIDSKSIKSSALKNTRDKSNDVCDGAADDGGWYTEPSTRIIDQGPCNIEVRHSNDLTIEEFHKRFAYKEPVIIIAASQNEDFRKMCQKDKLLEKFGEKVIRLSTANTYSYNKYDVSFSHYVEKLLKPQTLSSLGNETFYYFGDNNYTEWAALFSQYQVPKYSLPGLEPALSFGIAGAGTGVPLHFHGPGFAEVIFGRKRWFLYPPDYQPDFDPDMSTLSWVVNEYPKLQGNDAPRECTLKPGEVIYFPNQWWHGTLNLDTSVFISTFLG